MAALCSRRIVTDNLLTNSENLLSEGSVVLLTIMSNGRVWFTKQYKFTEKIKPED
jgi:hypothetical protein